MAALVLTLALGGSSQAQNAKKVYLVKGSKIVGTFAEKSVDYITFDKPDGATQADYAITASANYYCTVNCPKRAEAGQTVIFSVTVASQVLRPSGVTANGTACKSVHDDGLTWYYEFEMPAEDVTLSVETEADRHDIAVSPGQGTTITMLNCSDDWDKPEAERKFNEVMGGYVKFLWEASLGYDATLSVTTESGEAVEYSYVEDDESFGACWQFVMPDEAVTIKTVGTEKTDYAGKPFVGTYKGYALTVGDGHVVSSSAPVFTVTLNANTSFTAQSTDANGFDFDGCYKFDESKNTFAYLADYSSDAYGEKDYGVSGTWFEGGDALAFVSDLQEDKPDNVRYYFVSTADFASVVASSDSYGSRFLVEMQKGTASSWYYFDKLNSTTQPVRLAFLSGSSIAGASSAMVYATDGTPLFRYTRQTATSEPQFTLKGSEAGTYTSATTGSTLTLDGFGSATYGYVSGTYTIDKQVVKFTSSIDGTTTTFVIDTTTMTYTTSASAEWDGAENFFASVTGQFDGSSSTGYIVIQLNHNAAGNESKGNAKFQVTLTDPNMYTTKEIISSTAAYVYDASASTLTFTGILVGTEDGRSTERTSVTFSVSTDKQTITCGEDRKLRAPSGGDTRYIELKGLTLAAK